jgi:prepilin-type N-terminal cleavage/methylation domain-containing protein
MSRLVHSQRGFTLIELLVVIAIIGILAAIAIPQFAAYRRRGFDSQVKSDLRNIATAQEAYFTDKNTYSQAIGDLTGTRGYRQSANVKAATTGTSGGFLVTGTASSGCSGSSGTWTFDSTTGQIAGDTCD